MTIHNYEKVIHTQKDELTYLKSSMGTDRQTEIKETQFLVTKLNTKIEILKENYNSKEKECRELL